jgi:hypothetical protein
MNHDNSVSIVTDNRVDDRGYITGTDKEFYLRHRIQTLYTVHPSSDRAGSEHTSGIKSRG